MKNKEIETEIIEVEGDSSFVEERKDNKIEHARPTFKEKQALKREEKQIYLERERVYKRIVRNDNARLNNAEIAMPAHDEYLVLRKVNKIYDNYVQAVFDFDLVIKQGEFIVFVGPSGCGKSTTLRMIAGLEDITAGDLFIDGTYANNIAPKNRNMAMVFQSYALYPHLNVYDNLAFSLKLRKHPKAEIYQRVKEAARILELENYLDRKPRELSGGQRQRVALGRAIVRNANIFLMDEPLSNLDAKLRVQMRSEIVRIHNALSATTIYVTHDQTEAMTMADRIVVMNKGYIQQIGTPQEIYDNPKNTFVATFIGSPAMNILEGKILKSEINISGMPNIKLQPSQTKDYENFYHKRIALLKQLISEEEENIVTDIKESKEYKKNPKDITPELISSQALTELRNKLEAYTEFVGNAERRILFGIRPEDFKFADLAAKCKTKLVVNIAELMGREYFIHSTIDGQKVVAKLEAKKIITINDFLTLDVVLSRTHVFDPISGDLIY